MLIWIIIAIIIVLAIAFVGMYNSFIKLKNSCEEAFSTMDVYMKKRFDLIPNLVETVKGYASHEKETLEKVIAARITNKTLLIKIYPQPAFYYISKKKS